MRKRGHLLREITYIALFLFLVTGCSGGGGNPLVPASPGDTIDHPTQSGGGNALRAEPAFSWNLTEPANLFEEGWGRLPATIATSFTFSATLGGTKADWFDGTIFFSIDGEPRHFSFSNNIINADISGLEPGIHNVYLLAASSKGEAGRSFEFEVLDKPPSMQIGIGIKDGKLHISPDRPMPASQLGDLSRWNIDGFLAEKLDIEVTPGNDTVIIGLTEERSFDDYMMYKPDDISPNVTFNSSLGEMKCKLYNDDRKGGRYAQVAGCLKGTVYPIGDCDPASGWEIDLTHFVSVEREAREVLNTETSMMFGNCPYGGGEPWENCQTWTVVAYNWVQEGHLDPEDYWDAQNDTQEYNTSVCGYKGVGYRDGYWEHYDRNRGFFPPSLCSTERTQWEVRIDCNICDGSEPYGYESKGWHWGEDLEVDSTCPEFLDIQIIKGEDLNDYVQNELISDLQGRGTVYTAENNSGPDWFLNDYYMSRCGNAMPQWLNDHPCGLVFIVKAQDVTSDQGRFISHMLSIDMEVEPGDKTILEDEVLHFYYVDTEDEASEEYYGGSWPQGASCSEPLPQDGSPHGEFSCWIVKAGTCWVGWESCRFRIKDDCNNWTRSENLVPGGERGGMLVPQINVEPETIDVDENASVEFNAEYTGSIVFQNWFEDCVEWYILKDDVEYTQTMYPLSGCNSVIQSDPWEGTSFQIENLLDCKLDVRARMKLECAFNIFGDASAHLKNDVELKIENGISRYGPGFVGPLVYEIYWIDGPAIPIYQPDEWDQTSLQTIVDNTTFSNNDLTAPTWNDLRVGEIKIKVCVDQDCFDYFDYYKIYAKGPNEVEYEIEPHVTDKSAFCETPKVWSFPGNMPCGEYKIHVDAFRNQEEEPFIEEESSKLYLDKVIQSDLLLIVPLFAGKTYSQMDCSHFVTYVLRWLARPNAADYPIGHIDSTSWKTSDRATTLGSFGDIQRGDVLVWGDTNHVGIFEKWDTRKKFGHNPSKGIYRAFVWESRLIKKWNKTTQKMEIQYHLSGVGLNSMKLLTQAEYDAIKANDPEAWARWHIPRTWADNDIFYSCTE